jgi:competence protein ComEA
VTSTASRRLRALTRTAYEAAAGHLDVEPDGGSERRPRRWALAPRPAVAATVLVLLVGALVATRLLVLAGGPVPVPVPAAAESVPATDPGPGAGTEGGFPGPEGGVAGPEGGVAGPEGGVAGPEQSPDGARPPHAAAPPVVVHVAGHVARPGVVELPPGSRVGDALAAAGGASDGADLAAVNLARPVADGEQVYVPAPGEAIPPQATGRGASPGAGDIAVGPVDLNTATLAELDALPGIGPVLAGRILEWRAAHGGFTLVDELGEVPGIGPTLLGRLRDLVTL